MTESLKYTKFKNDINILINKINDMYLNFKFTDSILINNINLSYFKYEFNYYIQDYFDGQLDFIKNINNIIISKLYDSYLVFTYNINNEDILFNLHLFNNFNDAKKYFNNLIILFYNKLLL